MLKDIGSRIEEIDRPLRDPAVVPLSKKLQSAIESGVAAGKETAVKEIENRSPGFENLSKPKEEREKSISLLVSFFPNQ